MPKPAAPTSIDLLTLLQSSLLLDNPMTAAQVNFQLDAAIAAAVSQWELDTQYHPFLAVSDTRLFDPPGPEKGPVGIYLGLNNLGGGSKLFFGSGAIDVEEVRILISAANPTGTVLNVNDDYYLRPQAALHYGRPYSYIEFRLPQYGMPASIQVKAAYGYAREWPDDAWLAVLRSAALQVLPEIIVAKTNMVQKIEQGPVTIQYRNRPLIDEWTEMYNRTVARYARKSIR